jgi:transcriptional regulator with XRE-family HTH domain
MVKVNRKEALKIVCRNIVAQMEQAGLGICELGRLSQVNAMTISRIVNAKSLPAADALYRIACSLNVSVDSLFQRQSGTTKKSA